MARDDELRNSLEDLIAALRASHEEHQALAGEIRLLRQEIRALREESPGRRARLVADAPARGSATDLTPMPPSAGPAPARVPATDWVPMPPSARPAAGWRERARGAVARLRASIGAPRLPVLERPWVVSVAVGLVVLVASALNVFQPLEVLAEYPRQWARSDRHRPEVARQIVVVAIDRNSVAALGPWGKRWRAYHGDVLRTLADAGARAVGFDMYFNQPSDEYDAAFLEGIRYARSKGTGVVVGTDLDPATNRLSAPFPALRDAVTAFAATSLQKDRVTNLVRYVSLFQASDPVDRRTASVVPAFSMAVALAGGNRLEDFPRYRDGAVPIQFAGATGRFETVEYADLHARRFSRDAFAGKYVFVGVFLPASKDFVDTPVESQMPGVVVHGNALYTLLGGVSRPVGLPWTALVILVMATATGAVYGRVRKLARVLLITPVVVTYWAVAIVLERGATPLRLEVVPATAAVALVWGAMVIRERTIAFRELRRGVGLPERAFRRLEKDQAFQQGRLAKRLTVLASDVRNYSVFSRAHSPAHVREIMTQYHGMAERAIARHGGFVNKFIGDAVLAVFGYPMDEENTARRAILAAQEIQQGLRALNEKWARENVEGISEVRIGINTGPVNVSYLGSSKKQLDIMGDNVDLAARLEAAAGHVHCIALLSPETYAEVRDVVNAPKVPVELKNRPDVTEAYSFEGLVENELDALGRVSRAEPSKVGRLLRKLGLAEATK